MTIAPHWFLPTIGEIAQAAERLGFDAALTPAAPARRSLAATNRSPTGLPTTTELGIDEFILAGYPHLEEAYRVGEGVLPVLRRRGLLASTQPEPETLEV